jgi:hypothetical protein
LNTAYGLFNEAVINRSWVSVITPILTRPTSSQQRADYNEMSQKDKDYFVAATPDSISV